jgi:uncharacterized SAM-binding protein YcdF (DUF218 family)
LSTRRHPWRWFLAAILIAVVIYTAVLYRKIQQQMWVDETRPADAIVVLGAAEYAGRPSPIFRARLDHGLVLFHRGIAPMMITTGGHGEDPQFSEGGVGKRYLVEHGVPDPSIIAETQADNTDESTERVKRMLGRYGVQVYGAPRPQPRPQSRVQRAALILREVLSYTLWRLHIT